MTALRNLTRPRFPAGASEIEELHLGLPLEHSGRTIYAVFTRDATRAGIDAKPRQIGYLELEDGESVFTALEHGSGRKTLIPVLLTLFIAAVWLLWKLSNKQRA